MSFMKKEVCFGLWIEVETNAGTECIDADVIFNTHTLREGDRVKWEDIKDYIKGKELVGIPEVVRGYGARMNASDCTEWTLFGERQEALDFLEEMYGEEA